MEHQQVLKLFGQQLKQLRHEKNETLQSLSENSDFTMSDLSDLENGKGNPELKTLCKAADTVGADLMIWLRKRK